MLVSCCSVVAVVGLFGCSSAVSFYCFVLLLMSLAVIIVEMAVLGLVMSIGLGVSCCWFIDVLVVNILGIPV